MPKNLFKAICSLFHLHSLIIETYLIDLSESREYKCGKYFPHWKYQNSFENYEKIVKFRGRNSYKRKNKSRTPPLTHPYPQKFDQFELTVFLFEGKNKTAVLSHFQ